MQEEKEAVEIKNKIPEFKTSKAYDGFYLLATVIDFKRTVIIRYIVPNYDSSCSMLIRLRKSWMSTPQN